jgi:hypothetical protein
MGLLDVARQAEQVQLGRDVNMSRHGMLNDDTPLQRAQYGGMYGSLMQDPADKARMERQMMEDTLAMMPMAGMTTYHGSPHIFNKFRMDKVGTGEGAQAYGHGLYLAENPNVAKEYQRNTAQYRAKIDGKEAQFPGADNETLDALTQWFGSRPKGATIGQYLKDLAPYRNKEDRLLENSAFYLERAADRYGHGAKISPAKNSNFYKVDLPDDQIKNMLDWDKPIKDQKHIMKLLDDKFVDGDLALRQMGVDPSAHGDKLYFQLGGGYKAPAVSQALREWGIPGIKYLDEGSRRAGQGTRNFVVFDENIPQILERNQQPIGGLLGK